MTPLLCIKRALLIIKLHQIRNQTKLTSVSLCMTCYLWVHCDTVQCLFYDGLPHFRCGCACHVEAVLLHCTPKLIFFISVKHQNQELIFSTLREMSTCT